MSEFRRPEPCSLGLARFDVIGLPNLIGHARLGLHCAAQTRMKLRRAAVALAVGWYLMVAPAGYEPDRIHPAPSLSRWYIAESFDTAQECEHMRMDSIMKTYGDVGKNTLHSLALACISSDDPRLKEK